jgi:bifunctional DNase/RNase
MSDDAARVESSFDAQIQRVGSQVVDQAGSEEALDEGARDIVTAPEGPDAHLGRNPGSESFGSTQDLAGTPSLTAISSTTDRLSQMRPVVLLEVGVALPETYGRMVLQDQADTKRLLTIPVSLDQASQLAVAVHSIEVPRPLASDLVHSIFAAFDINLDMVAITGFTDGNYLAEVVITGSSGRHRRLPARASDAVLLATRARPTVPIMVSERLLSAPPA